MVARRFPPLPPLDTPLPTGNGLHRVQLTDGASAWLKRRDDTPVDFLLAEARGLDRLRETGGLRVPAVLGLDAHRLLLEDLGHGMPGTGYAAHAGHGLAVQHGHAARRFGGEHEGWCGDTRQDNTPDGDGHRFFAQRRLMPLAQRTHARGRLEANDLDRVTWIAERLRTWIPEQPPVLVHGDLWSGNLHCCGDGQPALIDAGAVHDGWAESDLAMLILFGEPDARLFDAYAERAPLRSDWRERAPLYNLYHLLNHLDLFGHRYLGAVKQVLDRFAGRR